MALNQTLIAELKHEAATTRRLLERIPGEQFGWQPHAKSMTIGRLATHVAELPGYITNILITDERDMGTGPFTPTIAADNKELLELFDKKVNEAIVTLENTKDEDFNKQWVLRRGDQVVFTLPKVAAIRTRGLSHLYHHRGQLSVYLRLLDIPVPGVYGPSADER